MCNAFLIYNINLPCVLSALKRLVLWPQVLLQDLKKRTDYQTRRKRHIDKAQQELMNQMKGQVVNMSIYALKTISKESPPDPPPSPKPKGKAKPKKREYRYVDWAVREPRKKMLHKSMMAKGQKGFFSTDQEEIGDCVLCTGVFSATTKEDMIRHYEHVHYARRVTVDGVRILMCKCAEVRPRGGTAATEMLTSTV